MTPTPKPPSSIRWLVYVETQSGEVLAPTAAKALTAAHEAYPERTVLRVQSAVSAALDTEQARIAARHRALGLRTPAGEERTAEGKRWDPRTVARRPVAATDPATDPEAPA